jgi:hypothetical protein
MATVKQTAGKRRVGDGTPGPGRPKGVPNKNTTAVKDMILAALNQAGGIEYLVRQSIENPTAFLTLVGKVLPLDVNANVQGQIGMPTITLGVQPE